MSQLVEGIRVITEGPPPVRDVTDPPAIPARFTPPPVKERLAPPPVEAAPPVEPTVVEEPQPEPPVDAVLEGSLDPDWAQREPSEEVVLASGPPPWAIGAAVAVAAAAVLGVGALALW